MGVVYHANYLIWMEMARTELCRVRGVRYRDIEANDGLVMVVAEASCRYQQPARYDDEIVAQATIQHAHPRMITFAYTIRSLDGTQLATGETRHLFLRDGRPVKIPAKYYALFGLE